MLGLANACVLPVMIYGLETMAITPKKAEKLRVAQRAMERAMLGLSLRDRVRNEQVRRLSKVEDVIERIAKAKWQWAGHVARGDQEKWTTKLMQWRPRTSRRSAGRPQKRWVDDIKEVTGPMWQRKAQDRAQWKTLGETFVQEWMAKG